MNRQLAPKLCCETKSTGIQKQAFSKNMTLIHVMTDREKGLIIPFRSLLTDMLEICQKNYQKVKWVVNSFLPDKKSICFRDVLN